MAPNVDAKQFMNLYGTNGFNVNGAINLAGSAIGGQSYGEIAWFSNAVQTMGNGTTEQKVQTGMNFVTKLVSLFTSGEGVKEGKKAETDVAKHTTDAQEVINNQKTAQDELQSKINKVNNEIEQHLEAIETELDQIADTGNEVSEKQEQVNEIYEKIEAKKAELETATTKEEKEAILEELQGLSGELSNIIAEIESLNNDKEESQDSAEEQEAQVENTTSEATDITSKGQEDIANIQNQGMQSLNNAAIDKQTGIQDTKAGTELEIKAASMTAGTFGFGAAKAAQMQLDATGFFTGAGIRTPGSLAISMLAQQGLGGLNNNFSMLTNFDNAIGSFTNSFANYLGDFNTQTEDLSGIISGFGSVDETAETINTAVENDREKIQNENEEENNNTELESSQIEVEDLETEA